MKRNQIDDLFSLYRMCLDLEQIQSDRTFSSGGEFIYFVDTNVVEIFVHPSMSAPITRLDSSEDENILSLLTSEFIMSGNLPGNSTRSVFLTPHHRGELRGRFLDIHFGCMSEMIRLGREIYESQYEQRIQNLLAKGLNESQFRSLARSLSQESCIEPIEQMNRIFSERMLVSHKLGFKVSEPDLLKAESDGVGIGEKIFESWNPPKGISNAKVEEKKRAALLDGKALSLLHWLTQERLCDSQQIIFITNDSAILNGYREWHMMRFSRERVPFIVRPASQFLPLLNLDAAGNNSEKFHNEARDLFLKMRELVELAILPNAFLAVSRNRLRLTREDFSIYKGDEDELARCIKWFNEAHSHSGYFFSEYLAERLSPQQKADYEKLDKSELSVKIKQDLLRRVVVGTSDLIRDLARSSVRFDIGAMSRIPRTLYFPIQGQPLYRFVDRFAIEPFSESALIEELTPPEIFAVCAGLALGIETESTGPSRERPTDTRRNAARYALLCASSGEWLAGLDREIFQLESSFLCAIVQRFLVGDARTHSRAETYFHTASEYISSAFSACRTPEEYTRVRAEKAALLMFMATQYLMAAQSDVDRVLNDRAELLLAEAENLLHECLRIHGPYSGKFDDFSEVKRHYTHNIAGVSVIRRIGFGMRAVSELEKSLRQPIELILRDLDMNVPRFLVAELHCFLAILDEGRDALMLASEICGNGHALRVDNWQAGAMKKFLSERLKYLESTASP